MLALKRPFNYQRRFMIHLDLSSVEEIEQLCESVGGRWTRERYEKALRSRDKVGFVVHKGDKVLGVVIIHMRKSHLGVLRLLVHPDYRNVGVGTYLIDYLKERCLKYINRPRFTIEVDERDVETCLWLKNRNVRATGIEKENIVFEWSLTKQEECVGI